MGTAKLSMSGNSQIVRLPEEFRLPGTEVGVKKVGDTITLFPIERAWETFLEGLNGFPPDFFAEGRDQGELQEREPL